MQKKNLFCSKDKFFEVNGSNRLRKVQERRRITNRAGQTCINLFFKEDVLSSLLCDHLLFISMNLFFYQIKIPMEPKIK